MAKSWDIQPRKKVTQEPTPQASAPAANPRGVSRPVPQPARRVEPMVRRSALQKPQQKRFGRPASATRSQQAPQLEPIKVSSVRRERVPQGRAREPLKNRRKRERRVAQKFLAVAIVFFVIAAAGSLWLPMVRIQTVSAAGQEQSGMQQVAQTDLAGTYYYLFPRDSIFFFPSGQIRADIIAQYPDISAVSISRTSFHSILLSSVSRETAFLWCGSTYGSASPTAPIVSVATSTQASTASSTSEVESATTTVDVISSCYDADSQGFIFAQDTTAAPDAFRIYGPLDSSDGGTVIGSHIANAGAIPDALEFVKAIRSLGVSVVALVMRGDEADVYAQSGTRITYVLGQEQMAAQLAQSAFPSLNLNDGSLEYVDLRFAGKVYFKKSGTASGSVSSTSQ